MSKKTFLGPRRRARTRCQKQRSNRKDRCGMMATHIPSGRISNAWSIPRMIDKSRVVQNAAGALNTIITERTFIQRGVPQS